MQELHRLSLFFQQQSQTEKAWCFVVKNTLLENDVLHFIIKRYL